MTSSAVAGEDAPHWEIRQGASRRSHHGVDRSPIDRAAPASRVVTPIARARREARHQVGYSLGDLLGDSRWGLQLLTGGEAVLATPLLGAHAVELECPSRWLDSGWMMLTTGSRLRNKPQLQRALVAELQELGASCLGLGIGPSFRRVPPALIDEARQRNFPVVLVPEETQFRDIERAIFQSTQSMEASTFSRLSSLQQNLIRALSDADPLDAIVRRLSGLVHADVAVMSLDGEISAATGSIPLAEIAAEVARHGSTGTTQIVVGDWHVHAASLSVLGVTSQPWLVVASRGNAMTGELGRAAVQVTVPLLDALLRLNTMRLGQERATRESLLNSVLDGDRDSADSQMMSAHISATGMTLGHETRAVVVAEHRGHNGQASDRDLLGDAASWVHSTLEESNTPYLLSQKFEQVVVVLTGELELRSVIAGLLEQWPSLTVGIGRPIDSLAEIRASHRDAQLAVQHLTLQGDEKVLWYDDLDLVTQLLGEIPAERFEAKAASMARLLEENPSQLEALRAYFAQNRDIKAAAESIFLHPNTLRYRLGRLEQALGRSLHEPSVTASLYCVLATMGNVSTRSHR